MKTSQNKKKQCVAIQRNILASPYDKFWPLLSPADGEVVLELLKTLLPVAAIPKSYITSKKLRQIYREKDKFKRKKLWKLKKTIVDETQVDAAKQNRKHLLLGVNSVTRGIENSKVAGCLISADVSPRLIVSHIVTMAARSSIPVLVLPALKDITRSSLGIPCLAFGLHSNIVKGKDNVFHPLYETIVKLAEKFVVPEHLLTVNGSDDDDDDEEEEESESVENDDVKESFGSGASSLITTISKCDIKMNNQKRNEAFTYLYRSCPNRRAYIPPKEDIKLESTHLTFIPIEGGNRRVENDYSHRSNKRIATYSGLTSDDDDDDVNDNIDLELLPDSDNLFCIDTKGSDKVIEINSKKLCNSRKVNLKPTVVKKIKNNINKRKIV